MLPTRTTTSRRSTPDLRPLAPQSLSFSGGFRGYPFLFASGGVISVKRGVGAQRRKGTTVAYTKQVDLLEPIDMAEHLDKIELYLGQVCAIAGISKMQLDYWTNKAQIPTKGKKQRIYDMQAVETVMLIKQAKDKGLNLGAAIDAARRFRDRAIV